ncbi:S9 family peptidase [Deinococcus sp.]|uniref:alpha/beta hydrolase family protein n=1 Tax=Deinococcus sp. TaxID=47478 RepID=UPI0025B89D90|nr:alpha/beta hydrolase [Deinococcus sp.]
MPTNLLHRLKSTPKRKLALWTGLAYATVVVAGAFLGVEIILRSKTQWVKGEFIPVGRRRNKLYLPASPETLSKGPLGVVPLLPNRGHLVAGERRMVGTVVERPILQERGKLPHGALAWVSTYLYNGTPAQLGAEYEDVTVHTQVGDMPAWHVPPHQHRRDALIVVIHGHGGQRAQALRMLPAMLRTGCGSLFVTFRNAFGAPKVGKGYLTLGDTEAEDVLGALHWARENGYRRVILFGFSMGGNIALSVLRPKFQPYPLPVVGVMLDSPALDWRATIRWQAQRFGLPKLLARQVGRFTEKAVTRRSGQDFNEVDQLAAAARFSVPMLLWHGTRDRTIPIAQAEAFAAARPDLVDFHRVEGAKHIRTWNISPKDYDEQLERFVARVLA